MLGNSEYTILEDKITDKKTKKKYLDFLKRKIPLSLQSSQVDPESNTWSIPIKITKKIRKSYKNIKPIKDKRVK